MNVHIYYRDRGSEAVTFRCLETSEEVGETIEQNFWEASDLFLANLLSK